MCVGWGYSQTSCGKFFKQFSINNRVSSIGKYYLLWDFWKSTKCFCAHSPHLYMRELGASVYIQGHLSLQEDLSFDFWKLFPAQNPSQNLALKERDGTAQAGSICLFLSLHFILENCKKYCNKNKVRFASPNLVFPKYIWPMSLFLSHLE